MTYTAYGSFAPIYTDAISRLYETLYPDQARRVENVLRRVAEHASALGTCWPGIRRIVETCHYSETTVKRALTVLIDLDYIRFHVEHSRARRRQDVTWQVNPRVLYIAPDYISEAESLWNEGLKHCNVIFNEQPDSEPESEPDALTKTRTKTRTTTTTKKSGSNRKNARPATVANGDSSSNPVAIGDENHQREAQNPEHPPSSAPPPLEICRQPIGDQDTEDFAQRLASDMGTRIAQSRQLVLQFGVFNIALAQNWLKAERTNGRDVRNPFGLMKWWLTCNVLTEQPQPAEGENGERYTSGEFSDFINRPVSIPHTEISEE